MLLTCVCLDNLKYFLMLLAYGGSKLFIAGYIVYNLRVVTIEGKVDPDTGNRVQKEEWI